MAGPISFQPAQKVGGGRFTLVQVLGRGGMGEVWLAQDERLHESVALKFLPPEVAADPAALDDLRRETARSHRLTHPNIVRIHDFHEPPGEPAFISMEYVEGWTLTAVRVEQPGRVLSWKYLSPLVQQLCAALEYAHGENVIHRDLKPANLMVDKRGRLKLADFGIAATVSDSVSRISLRHASSGTLAYMSPQQLKGKRPSVADDIYALGATLYELLTSKPPFYSGDITHQVLNEAPEPPDARLAALELTNPVPPDVSAMIMASLAKDPAGRPQSARAVAGWIGVEAALPAQNLAEAVFASRDAETISTAAQPPSAASRRKPQRFALGVAVAVAILILGLAAWLRGRRGESGANTHSGVAAKIRIVLVGDSTVSDSLGWGPGFKTFLSDQVECTNVAATGHSSMSFIKEGLWTNALALGGDYYLIQFGHNNQPGKPRRSTDMPTFAGDMKRYVEDTRAIGAKPVLVTPLTLRQWDNSNPGKIKPRLVAYAEKMKEIGTEMQIPVIDLHSRSIEMCEKLGPDGCIAFSPARIVNGTGTVDNAHVAEKGSQIFGKIVAEELIKVVPELRPYCDPNHSSSRFIGGRGPAASAPDEAHELATAPAQDGSPAAATVSEITESDFISLFNGRDLTGWDGDPRFWSVENGSIVGRSTSQTIPDNNTFLVWTGGQPGDFELRAESRMPSGNSGIQFRSRKTGQWRVVGYQDEIDAINTPAWAVSFGGLVNEPSPMLVSCGEKALYRANGQKQVTGATECSFEQASAAFKPDGWNEYVIIARGNHVVLKLNGLTTVDFMDERPSRALSGVLALQLHRNKGQPMRVEFRNIRLKQLTANSQKSESALAGPVSIGASMTFAPPQHGFDFAGPGSGPGKLTWPKGLAVDPDGDVFVADSDNHRIQKFSGSGTFLTRWGSHGKAPGQFDSPTGVSVDRPGNVYVADSKNHRIQKFTRTGALVTRWGVQGSDPGQFNLPWSVAVDTAVYVYVADLRNNRIQKFSDTGAFIGQWGGAGQDAGQFRSPRGIAVDPNGSVYVLDQGNHRIQKFTLEGKFVTQWGSRGSESGQFGASEGIAVDGNGNVYVSEEDPNFRVQAFDAAGHALGQWGERVEGTGIFPGNYHTTGAYSYRGIGVNRAGTAFYVLDLGNCRVRAFACPVALSKDMPDVRSQSPAAADAMLGSWISPDKGSEWSFDPRGAFTYRRGDSTCTGTWKRNGNTISVDGKSADGKTSLIRTFEIKGVSSNEVSVMMEGERP